MSGSLAPGQSTRRWLIGTLRNADLVEKQTKGLADLEIAPAGPGQCRAARDAARAHVAPRGQRCQLTFRSLLWVRFPEPILPEPPLESFGALESPRCRDPEALGRLSEPKSIAIEGSKPEVRSM